MTTSKFQHLIDLFQRYFAKRAVVGGPDAVVEQQAHVIEAVRSDKIEIALAIGTIAGTRLMALPLSHVASFTNGESLMTRDTVFLRHWRAARCR